MLTVDRVAPARPEVVLVVVPERDTRYSTDGPPDAPRSALPLAVAIAAASTGAFAALRWEAGLRARCRRA